MRGSSTASPPPLGTHSRGAPEAAVAALERAPAEPPSSLATRSALLLDLGRAASALGRPDAVEHVRAALAAAPDPWAGGPGLDAGELIAWLDRSIASGVRVRRDARTGIAALTPSERRIVEHAAAGATNPQIAQALFVTVKTVEMHLGNAFRKLDVSSRHALAGHLADDPLKVPSAS